MANNLVLGGTLRLDGAPEYKRDLKEVTSQLKDLQSQMRVNDEQFKTSQNSAEALAKKSEILTKEYQAAAEKVQLYSQRLEEVRAVEEQAAAKVEEYRNQLLQAENALKQMKDTGTAMDSQIKEQAASVEDLKNKLADAENYLSTTIVKENQLETSLNNATAEELRYGTQLQATNTYLQEAQNSTDGLAHSINEYGKETNKAGEETEKLNEKLDRIMRNEAFEKISEGAKALVETMKECAESAENFEYAIAKVQSIAKVSDSELDGMSSEIRRVGEEMGYSATDISEAVYQAISASVDASEAIGFVEDATKLARAGFTEVATAVDVTTTALNAYGKEANTTAHIADDLITTQNLGKTTVDQLAESIGTIIPTASAYGVSLDQLSSAYVILTRNGVNTAYATTYLRGMMNELADAGSDVAGILYDQTGHSFGELMKMGWSLGDVLELLGNSVDGNTESFANLFGNIRAGQGALNIFNAGADEFNRILEIMGNNAGATDEAFQTMADTAVMTNERFEASLENLKISIGESLSPTIERLKEIGIEALEPVTRFIEEHPNLIVALTGAATALSILATGATVAATAIAIFKAVCGDVSGIMVLSIAGITAMGGAIAGLAMTANDASAGISDLTSSIQENTEAITTSWNDLKNLQAEHRNTSSSIRELRDRFAELTKEDITNADTKRELMSVIAQLNEAIPGLNISYENLTTGVDGNTEAVLENIDALAEQNEMAAKREELAEIEKTITETTNAHAEAEEHLKEILEEKNRVHDEQLEYQKQYGETNADLLDQLLALNEAEKAAREEKNETAHVLDEATERYETLSESVQELQEAEDQEVESAQAAAEAEKAKNDAIKEATDAIESQVGILEEWSEKSKLTFEEMIKVWEGQNEGLSQYQEDLSRAKEILEGEFDPAVKDLTSAMVELDDAATLHEFIEGLNEAIESGEGLTELTQLWQEHLDKMAEAEELYAEILLTEQGYTEESRALQEDFYAAKNESRDLQNEEELAKAEEQKEALTLIATETVNSMSEAITTATETTLKPAVQLMAKTTVDTAKLELAITEDNPKSQKFITIGRDGICGGLAQGIEDGTSLVVTAIQNLVSRAVDAVDVSGLVAKIDAKLGEAFGG